MAVCEHERSAGAVTDSFGLLQERDCLDTISPLGERDAPAGLCVPGGRQGGAAEGEKPGQRGENGEEGTQGGSS
ncbi:Hypothetical protein CAP_5441 [Chondromyces apiculatus DSM 436]|uniref:Uncharacterized protein n=1 Tax=Chondromyces apiculatus DSM 436 TaxID=1192034 RepID=A0A017T392_9BACT|nr:Hypothetical protein CAP_5441 [Chondromyces apiculatus DSM 436]